MTADLKALRDNLEERVEECSKVLKAFPRGEMGITPDHVKFSPEYRAAKADFNRAFGALQDFNRRFAA